MDVDTSSAVSLIPQDTWQKCFPWVKLDINAVALQTYTAETRECVGYDDGASEL